MAKTKYESKLYKIADQLRGEVDTAHILEEAINRDVEFSWQDIHPFISRIPNSDPTPPNYVAKFIVQYFADQEIKHLLDPWSRYGVLLTALMENHQINKATGIEIHDTAMKTAQAISKGLNIEWLNANSAHKLQELDGQFDAIVSAMPIGMRSVAKDYVAENETISLRDDENHLLILEAARKLSPSADAVFIQLNKFAWKTRQNDVASNLHRFGLYINSIIALPEKAYAPWTDIDTNIYFISKTQTEKVFVGFLDPDKNFEDLVVDIQAHKKGEKPTSEYVIPLDEFRSPYALISQEKIEAEAKKTGLPIMELMKIAKSIQMGRARQEKGGFEDLPNSVFLPALGNSPAVSRLSDLKINPHNCFQIALDDNFAMADYVAGFYNSPLGMKIRESLSRIGGTIPRIRRVDIQRALIILPDIEQQTRIVNAHNNLKDLKLLLDDQENILWAHPKSIQKIERKIQSFQADAAENFEDWMNSLPFPLASILWRYIADPQAKDKVEHLFHFFEAFSQFTSTLLLSVFYADEELFREYKSRWLAGIDGRINTFNRADFGSWVNVGERLAKHVRRMLSSKEQRVEILDLFGSSNDEFIQAISNSDIFEVLHTARNYRNSWKGHGGLSGDSENQRRLTLLETELRKLRETIRDCFDGYALYLPQENRQLKGIYYYKVKSIMGSNPLFRSIDLETTTSLDDGSLYFQDSSQRSPIKLIPFIVMLPSPPSESNACYFYSRLEQDTAKWVTYHFDQKPEEHLFPEDLGEFLEFLGSETNG